MKLAQRAYLGRDLTPYANCICLNISSWFGKVRVARARRDVTMHTRTRRGVTVRVDSHTSIREATFTLGVGSKGITWVTEWAPLGSVTQ